MTSPPVLLGHEAVLGELLAHLGGVGVGLVDLVDRDHDRHVRRLGVVQRLDRLGHDAVVGRDDEDGDVGHLRTAGTHGGERLVTRGVDEGDRALDALVLGPDLVGTDVLRDAAGFARDHVGLADGVEESRLTVVDVAHDGDHGRTDLEVVLALGLQLGVEVETEALEELFVFVLGRDHLDLVAELGTEHLEGGLVERLGRRGHLAQVEQDGHERAGLHGVAAQGLELVGEVGDGGTATQANDLAVTLRDVDAADDRRRPHLEFLPLRPTRLTLLRLAAALAEGTRGTTAGTTAATATATGTTGETAAARSTGCAAGTLEAATGAAGTTGTAGTLLERSAGTTATTGTTCAAGTRSAGTGGAGARSLRTRDVAGGRALAHALRRSEGVVAGARTRRTLAHALRRREGVVARTGAARARGRAGAGLGGTGAGRRGLGAGARRRRRGRRGLGRRRGGGCRGGRRRGSGSRSRGGGGLRGTGRGSGRTRTGGRRGTRGAGAGAGAGARRGSGGLGIRGSGRAFGRESGAELTSHGGLDGG
ncbi:hypothetical protein QE412_001344 [Microbacterium trichothecenolyticum]|uniref:Uncharacterized protein n=1 Tax=Microbacterium trichothecenolyticum TaxID=69370 RepID=A0ABU0TSY1_MICTR|nr:hypothetical protein [Microbacterium trichothecenolyticum]